MILTFRVCDYIKYGWDALLIDPDDGENVQRKLQATAAKHSDCCDDSLLQSIPPAKDSDWTKELYKSPKVTFGTIFKYLVDRKVILKRAVQVENTAEIREKCAIEEVGKSSGRNSDTVEPIAYTRSLDKAYRFFQDGHVQAVRFHPMKSQPNYVCIGANVLPSMKKGKLYRVWIVLSVHTARVEKAFCTCPAGLSGCCNHATATLYCMEEYFRLKLNEYDQKGCTEKLQVWNIPKSPKVDARPINLVSLTKKVYGVEKRPKVYAVNKWDCRPTSRRQTQPDRRVNLRKRLLTIDQARKVAATSAVVSATNDMQRKKVIEAQTMVMSYGTSCFLQLLDDEPAPSSVNRVLLAREARLARAEAQKSKLQKELSSLLSRANHDHSYSTCSISTAQYEVENESPPPHLIRNLYEEHVCVSPSKAAEIENLTRKQSLSDIWHQERAFRISASIMKTVCHRKRETNVKSFVTNKLYPKTINSAAINYGKAHEDMAIKNYIEYQEKSGVRVTVRKCGLYINPAIPWLASTPDSIVETDDEMGCLEVKCPYVCRTKQISVAALEQSSFCLKSNEGMLQLKKKHQYFYQIQTQLFVTRLSWCDFVVWAPNDIHVERILYDQCFIDDAVSKARTFYFDIYLPAIVPHVIISEVNGTVALTTEHCLKADDTGICSSCESSIVLDHSKTSDVEKIYETCHEVEILGASTIYGQTSHIDVLQKLNCRRHNIIGDGNCLYYAVAHQAGYIELSSHGDPSVGQQLRMLALITMEKYPDIRTEDGLSQQQWEQKKLQTLQPRKWGGDLEVRLLAIGLGKDIVVISKSEDKYTWARRFLSQPPPVPKMRGGIFIPVNITELTSQWKQYKPQPLLILYNGVNHYDSTAFL